MTEKNDGGPAFPLAADSTVYSRGMSLRAWFAGQALAGIMESPEGLRGPNDAAWMAIATADAMIAELAE